VAQQVMPDVPEKAIRTIQGKVKVSIQLNVDPSGAVSDASIASQGPSKYFANLALEAAKSWKFMPPQANGQGIASVWVLHFDFRQSGVDVTPTEQSP
jgi:TonB family protein